MTAIGIPTERDFCVSKQFCRENSPLNLQLNYGNDCRKNIAGDGSIVTVSRSGGHYIARDQYQPVV